MPLGFVIAGMALGLGSAILALVEGAGWGMALLAYVVCGSLGTGLSVLRALMGNGLGEDSDLTVPASRAVA